MNRVDANEARLAFKAQPTAGCVLCSAESVCSVAWPMRCMRTHATWHSQMSENEHSTALCERKRNCGLSVININIFGRPYQIVHTGETHSSLS